MRSAVASVADIAASDWDRLANPPGQPSNPLVSHAFFLALEQSGSATRRTGWAGRHQVLRDSGSHIVGIAPCYLKSHSRGEYVFDYGWAEAFQRAGGRYYPKLQVAVPFTPVTGPRLFAPTPVLRAELARGLITQCAEDRASSVHITFIPQADCEAFANGHWLTRTDIQFHWQNPGYATFDDFLKSLSSQKRKNIRKEREQVRAAGITFLPLTGRDITESHWDHFFDFYMETGSRKWGTPYLTRDFFSRIGASLANNILLVMAVRNGRIIAGALNFIGDDALYGRNWGASEHHPCLHFETCYYQAIDFAISRKLQRVEAGAQGPHKLARGYLPQTTYSLHYLAHPGLSHAVANYLEAERAGVAEESAALAAHSPFRHEQDF